MADPALAQEPIATDFGGTPSAADKTIALGGSVTAANFIALRLSRYNSGVIFTVSDGTNSYTQACAASATNAGCAIFYLPNVPGGTTTLTIHPSGSTYLVARIEEWSGIATAGTLDNTGTNSGTSGTRQTGSIPVSQSRDLVLGVFSSEGESQPFKATAGFIDGFIGSAGAVMVSMTAIADAAINLTYKGLSQNYAACGASFKAASPGGGGSGNTINSRLVNA